LFSGKTTAQKYQKVFTLLKQMKTLFFLIKSKTFFTLFVLTFELMFIIFALNFKNYRS